ncbi:hypothetical protein GN956_G6836 [Arapaima gigas]
MFHKETRDKVKLRTSARTGAKRFVNEKAEGREAASSVLAPCAAAAACRGMWSWTPWLFGWTWTLWTFYLLSISDRPTNVSEFKETTTLGHSHCPTSIAGQPEQQEVFSIENSWLCGGERRKKNMS